MRIGIKSGTFLILHAGHIKCLQFCKEKCDHLIILNNDDRYIYNKKGCIPLTQNERIVILSSIKYIDEVYTFSGLTEEYWVKNFKENILYQKYGNDAKLIIFHSPEVVNNPPCRMYADEIIYVPRDPINSTSKIFDEIKGIK